MKCKICQSIFQVDTSFTFLFKFPEICPECKKKYHPILKDEVIPTDYGLVTYYYLYDFPISLQQRNYLDRNLKLFYKYLLKQYKKYDLFLILDDFVIKGLSINTNLILSFGNILIFSLVYHDLTLKEIF
ncbi:MAG: hypothetical protein AB7E16_01425 [Candidatus Izemoplasmatales bacterium]